MKESIVQKWIRDKILGYYGYDAVYIKYPASQYSTKGVSDLIFCIHGFYVAIEVKTEIGKITKLQQIFQDQIKLAGGLAYVIYGKDEEAIKQVYADVRRKRIESSS